MDKEIYELEIENKFLTNLKTLESLIDFFSEDRRPFFELAVERDERTNIYYDTQKKFRLYERGVECRMREKTETKQKIDLKTPQSLDKPKVGPKKNGLMYRREYSYTGTETEPNLTWFSDPDVDHYLSDIFNKQLRAWVQGTFKRWKVTFAPAGNLDSKIEMALERGAFESIESGHSSDEMFFIEFESKDGNVDALLCAIEQFKQKYGNDLILSTRTKGELGLEWLAKSGGIMDSETAENFTAAQEKRQNLYTKHRSADKKLKLSC